MSVLYILPLLYKTLAPKDSRSSSIIWNAGKERMKAHFGSDGTVPEWYQISGQESRQMQRKPDTSDQANLLSPTGLNKLALRKRERVPSFYPVFH